MENKEQKFKLSATFTNIVIDRIETTKMLLYVDGR